MNTIVAMLRSPLLSRNLLAGIVQVGFWPLIRGSRWRSIMAASDLAPGVALLDLSIRRADPRRIILYSYAWWFLGFCLSVAGELGTMANILSGGIGATWLSFNWAGLQ